MLRDATAIALALVVSACGGGEDARGASPGPGDAASDAVPADAGAGAGPSFDKITLHRDFVCEGAAIGDVDGDGAADVVAGPRAWLGPDFAASVELWPTRVYDVRGYSDCFFQWLDDLNGDGRLDVLVVGFPGKEAHWLANPGPAGGPWMGHLALPVVDNESPEYLDLDGDGRRELLASAGGRLGFASPRPGAPDEEWEFVPISDDRRFGAFTHGLGAGDVDGDGHLDVLEATAWWRRPPTPAAGATWTRNAASFGSGGAQMFVTDVDGDGDGDVASTLAAHGWGLAWWEQEGPGSFVEHDIVLGTEPPTDASVVLHEPHALALADLDGDGSDDLITGERHWGHVPDHLDFDQPARLYGFLLRRDGGAPRWKAVLIDDDSGVGTQIATGDVNDDGRLDLAITNKKGAFIFVQRPPGG